MQMIDTVKTVVALYKQENFTFFSQERADKLLVTWCKDKHLKLNFIKNS